MLTLDDRRVKVLCFKPNQYQSCCKTHSKSEMRMKTVFVDEIYSFDFKRSPFDIVGETLRYRSRLRVTGNKGRIWLCEPGKTEKGQCMRIQIESRPGNSKENTEV